MRVAACVWGLSTLWGQALGHGSLHLGRRATPALPRFKQLLLTQADKFSPAEVRTPSSFRGVVPRRALGQPR